MTRVSNSIRKRDHAEPPTLVLADGASASVRSGALELRDQGGRLLVRYGEGAAEIAVPKGDLKLSAPTGRVVIQSGMDVTIAAARDVTHQAGRRLDLGAGPEGRPPRLRLEPASTEVTADRLAVNAKTSHVATGHATVLAQTIVTNAHLIATTAERYELTAKRLFEKSVDTFREVADLAESRMGRVRTLVNDLYALHTGRTTLISKEETTVDGTKILLG
jgi:hypothetical protein